MGFTAQIQKKDSGVTVYNLTQTFNDEKTADRWIKKVESELKSGTRIPEIKIESKIHTHHMGRFRRAGYETDDA